MTSKQLIDELAKGINATYVGSGNGTCNPIGSAIGNIWTDDNFGYNKEINRLNKQIDYLTKFLIMKGIIKEEELKEFLDAMDVAEKLADKESKDIPITTTNVPDGAPWTVYGSKTWTSNDSSGKPITFL